MGYISYHAEGVKEKMKLKLEEFEKSEQADPLELFNQGIVAEETRKKYTRTLRQVLCGMLEEIRQGTYVNV